jgi:hypothetical protein
MRKYLTPFNALALTGFLSIVFAGSGCVSLKQAAKMSGHGINQKQMDAAFQEAKKRFIAERGTGADATYRNIQGNEFKAFISSQSLPQGIEIWIDPDDVIAANVNGKVEHGARLCFYERINGALPPIPGEFPPVKMEKGESCKIDQKADTADGKSVAVLYDHLTKPYQPK